MAPDNLFYLLGRSGDDEREDENKHCGDIQDEPHDEDTDKEPSPCRLTADWPGGDSFDREHGEAKRGIADMEGVREQLARFVLMGSNSALAARLYQGSPPHPAAAF